MSYEATTSFVYGFALPCLNTNEDLYARAEELCERRKLCIASGGNFIVGPLEHVVHLPTDAVNCPTGVYELDVPTISETDSASLVSVAEELGLETELGWFLVVSYG